MVCTYTITSCYSHHILIIYIACKLFWWINCIIVKFHQNLFSSLGVKEYLTMNHTSILKNFRVNNIGKIRWIATLFKFHSHITTASIKPETTGIFDYEIFVCKSRFNIISRRCNKLLRGSNNLLPLGSYYTIENVLIFVFMLNYWHTYRPLFSANVFDFKIT